MRTQEPERLQRPAGPGVTVRLPASTRNMRIGLYGGSFDPAHSGHRLVAETALRRLRLDRVWWIVTPGNPLKQRGPVASRADRLAAARAMARHPAMDVTDVEGAISSTYTIDTLRFLIRRCPDVRFVWIMGADSLAGLHRWRSWRELASLVPFAVVDRPGWTLTALNSRASRVLAGARVRPADAPALADLKPPAWAFLTGPRSSLSSTTLRNKSRAGPARR